MSIKKTKSTVTILAWVGLAAVLLGCVAVLFFLPPNLFTVKKANSASLNDLSHAENGTAMLLKGTGGEVFLASRFPTLNGVKADGKTVTSEALQAALDEAGQSGGTVYLPAGIYIVDRPLTVPENVTLRGDFSSPDATDTGARTILYIRDSEAVRSAPFLTLGPSAELIGTYIEYETQNFAEPILYPTTVLCTASNTVRNLAVLNGTTAVEVRGNGRMQLESLFLSTVRDGLKISENDQSVSVRNASVTPLYQINENKGIEGTLKADEVYRLSRENTVGILVNGGTDVVLENVRVEGARYGISFRVPAGNQGILLLDNATVASCTTCLQITSLPKKGLSVSSSVFRTAGESTENCVEIGPDALAPALFDGCSFSGYCKNIIRSENNSFLSFYRCAFGTWWNACFSDEANTFLAVSCTYRTQTEKAKLGPDAFGFLYGTSVPESETLLFGQSDSFAPERTEFKENRPEEARTPSAVVYAMDVGILPEQNVTAALREALEKLAETGGTLCLPTGTYLLSEPITVPANVRLLGEKGTVLSYLPEKAVDAAMISLSGNSKLETLTLKGTNENLTDSTYAVSALYNGALLRDVTVEFPHGIRLSNCDGIRIENVRLSCEVLAISANKITNSALKDIYINASAYRGADGIQFSGGSVTADGLRLSGLENGIRFTGAEGELSFRHLVEKHCDAPLIFSGKESVSLYGTGIYGNLGNETATLIQTSADCASAITLQGGTVSSCGGTCEIDHRSGKITLQSLLITEVTETFVLSSDDASAVLSGLVFDCQPKLHAKATDTSDITFDATLLRSESAYEGIEDVYLLTDEGDTAKIETGTDLSKFVYEQAQEYFELEEQQDPGEEAVNEEESEQESKKKSA